MKSIIEVNDLKKVFTLSKKQMKIDKTTNNKKIALDGLSFTAYEGEIYGLLGANGAGKTTTLRCISTLIKPDSGSIFVDGVNALKYPEDVRRKIGFLTSDLKLGDFFTPSYLYDYYSDLHDVPNEIREERKKMLFERFGVDKFAEVKVGDLSTGMKQKASLVISLVHDPKIIIFDEPTNGLDVLTAKIVTDFLEELKKLKYTIIISTHIFSLIEKLCDRVGIIIDGKMKLEGYMKDLCVDKDIENVFFDLYKDMEVGL